MRRQRASFAASDRGQHLFHTCRQFGVRPREVLSWPASERAFAFAAVSEWSRRQNKGGRQ